MTSRIPEATLTIVDKKEVTSLRRFDPDKLLRRRKQAGKTQQELASEAGLSTVSVWAIENGRTNPRAATVARLAEALKCSIDYFFAP